MTIQQFALPDEVIGEIVDGVVLDDGRTAEFCPECGSEMCWQMTISDYPQLSCSDERCWRHKHTQDRTRNQRRKK